MAGQMVQDLLLRGLAEGTRKSEWPSNGFIIFIITRFANEIIPPFFLLIVNLRLSVAFINSRCPEYPSPANGTSTPVNCLGSYDGVRMDYLGPVKPGLSNQTSTSYVPMLFRIGTLTPVDKSI